MDDNKLEYIWNVDTSNSKPLPRLAYLLNLNQTTIIHNDKSASAFHFYFVDLTGNSFRVSKTFPPYLLIKVTHTFAGVICGELDAIIFHVQSVVENIVQKVSMSASVTQRVVTAGSAYFESKSVEPYRKELFIELRFETEDDLRKTRMALNDILRRNRVEEEKSLRQILQSTKEPESLLGQVREDPTYLISSILEADIEPATRALISSGWRCGQWYWVDVNRGGEITLQLADAAEQTLAPRLTILAWDIETYKDPLKFPDSSKDPIMCISYMTNIAGWLLINRQHFSKDIRDFNYRPTPEYGSQFKVYNFDDEKSLLIFFLDHVARVIRPHILVTYNGDAFDFPYVHERMARHGLDLNSVWGFTAQDQGGRLRKPEFVSKFIVHIDCLKWVERDSYLPCGSRGLKAVTRSKLHYEPREVDPELMVQYALSKPQVMSEYSVSDAVATYFLYHKYIHRFILALASIIPMSPDDVLRKGSGTLCEHLLMAEAYSRGICIPNKVVQETENWYKDQWLLFSETYVGGQVEQLRSGIFRDDLPEVFHFDASTIDCLQEGIDDTFDVWWRREINADGKMKMVSSNWSEVRQKIFDRLQFYKDAGKLTIEPLIYHVDVGAMYPNIILSQRLQPYAIVENTDCDQCVWKDEKTACQRALRWKWKAERFPLAKGEIMSIKDQLAVERHVVGDKTKKQWSALTNVQRQEAFLERLKEQSRKSTRGKFKIPVEADRENIVCQRASAFYVDTVRNFRDRRLVYKNKKKEAERKASRASVEEREAALNEVILWDSLQLAHKCILNSFYGYVMRKGARWYSLEMAAIVTFTGANVIKRAKVLCDGIGSPLELDTDGVWTLIPKGFPDKFDIHIQIQGRDQPLVKTFSYPCWMLNAEVEREWLNRQYHRFDFDKSKYLVTEENSVFFEIDGPYKAMFLPASEKEDQQLKKRYAVFDFNDQLVELKGFEMKRRGELQVLKAFQEEVFPAFLQGSTREQIYKSVGDVAKKWLNFISSHGGSRCHWKEILVLLSESKTLSKPAIAQGNYKSMGITAAHRLKDLLEDETYIKDSGVRAEFVISYEPAAVEKTSRAIPVLVFGMSEDKRNVWLSNWTRVAQSCGLGTGAEKQQKLDDSEAQQSYLKSAAEAVRGLLDWQYYRERLAVAIQKIVIIPAIAQQMANPVAEISLPEWLRRRRDSARGRQKTLSSFVSVVRESKMVDAHSAGIESEEADISVEAAEKKVSKVAPVRGVWSLSEFMRENSKWWHDSKRQLVLENRLESYKVDLEKSTTEDVCILLDVHRPAQSLPSTLKATVRPIWSQKSFTITTQQPRSIIVDGELDQEKLYETLEELDIPREQVAIGGVTGRKFGETMSHQMTLVQMPSRVLAEIQHLLLDGTFLVKGEGSVMGLAHPSEFMALVELGVQVRMGEGPWGRVCLSRDEGHVKYAVPDVSILMDCVVDIGAVYGRYVCVSMTIDSVRNAKYLSVGAICTHESRRRPLSNRMKEIVNLFLRQIGLSSNHFKRITVHPTVLVANILDYLQDSQKKTRRMILHNVLGHLTGYPKSLLPFLDNLLVDDQDASHDHVGRIARGVVVVNFETPQVAPDDLQPNTTATATGPSTSTLIDRDGTAAQLAADYFFTAYAAARQNQTVPIGNLWRRKLQYKSTGSPTTSTDVFVWDVKFGRLLNHSGEILTSICDAGAYRSADLLVEHDVLSCLSGGPSSDGTQDQSLNRKIPHLSFYTPRLFYPGLYRTQVAHLKFRHSAALHALHNLPNLANFYQIPINSRSAAATNHEKEGQPTERSGAFFVDLELAKKSSKNIRLEVDPTITQLLAIKQTQSDNDECLKWLLEPNATIHRPLWASELFGVWTPLLMKYMMMQLENLSRKVGQVIGLIAMWPEGLLLNMPTTNPQKAVQIGQLVREQFAVDKILRGLVDHKYLQNFRHGLQLDKRNGIFIDNEGDIGVLTLPSFNCLPECVATELEKRMIKMLEDPLLMAKRSRALPSKQDIEKVVRSLVTAGDWVSSLRMDAEEFETDECMGFRESIGLTQESRVHLTPVECANAICEKMVWLEPVVKSLEGGELAHLCESLRMESNDENDWSKNEKAYSAAVAIILPHMTCERCGYVEDLDLSFITAEEATVNCFRCDKAYSEDALEGRLVAIVERHIMALQNRDTMCVKCRRIRRLRVAKYCECGGGYEFSRGGLVDTTFLLASLKTCAELMGLPWLASVIDWAESLHL